MTSSPMTTPRTSPSRTSSRRRRPRRSRSTRSPTSQLRPSSTRMWDPGHPPRVVHQLEERHHRSVAAADLHGQPDDQDRNEHCHASCGLLQPESDWVRGRRRPRHHLSGDRYEPTGRCLHGSVQCPIKDNERNIAKYGNVVPVKVELASNCNPGRRARPHSCSSPSPSATSAVMHQTARR